MKDTPLEQKNHAASAKHQNNIQRSLRELQKGKQREEWASQRAKDEVARLNGLVGGKKDGIVGVDGKVVKSASVAASAVATPGQRRAQAEQLAAMGVALPEELKRAVTGVGGWSTVSERVVEEYVSVKGEEGEGDEEVKIAVGSMGVHKRKVEEDEDEAEVLRRRTWGSKLKSYPGRAPTEDTGDLDALLGGVGKKKGAIVKEETEGNLVLKPEPIGESTDRIPLPATEPLSPTSVKQEENADDDVSPPVRFKKRKIKR